MTARSVKLAAAAAVVLGAAFAAAPASAGPMLDPGVAHATDVAGAQPEAVRWVCGPYGCRWRPNYGFYGPRPYYGRPFYGPRRFYGYGRPRPFYRGF